MYQQYLAEIGVRRILGVIVSIPTLISLDSDAKAVYKVIFDDVVDTTTNKVVYVNAQGT